MESLCQFLKLCHVQTRRSLFVVAVVAVTYLLFQSLLLPYGKALQSLVPDAEVSIHDEGSLGTSESLKMSVTVRNPLTVNASDLTIGSFFKVSVKDGKNSKFVSDTENDSGPVETDGDTKKDFALQQKGQDDPIELVTDREIDDDSVSENVEIEDLNDSFELESDGDGENSSIMESASEARRDLPLKQVVKPSTEVSTDGMPEQHTSQPPKNFKAVKNNLSIVAPLTNITYLPTKVSNASSTVGSLVLESDLATSKNVSAVPVAPGKKKMRCEMPPKSITSIYEMNSILMRHRRSSRAMRPRWSSIRDQEILAVRTEIDKAPIVVNDRELYAPLFRNVSMFKRSYELMDRTLKVYVYRDGKKPIFHQPILKGLYASEGWFMKLMEGNKHFVVKDPQKAHLFYMPFSSRMLEYTLYVRNSHNRTNLRQYLKQYAESIAAKYHYWNRTGGADHFLVACHDWAPYETRHHMEHCIKALCNADVTAGFKIGRDVSLPETYIRSARNPLRDLGGKPPSQRRILAFYAGNMHGYLRPILLKYWKDKDPDMKIFGPMPPGVASKMNYIHHMKSSKYCICPKGYEVNSPRVVEAIFYECVPVIISDNFVPPFFEVLDWGAFSLIIAEKDIPNLKDILLSIPEEKYLQMQLAVRKVQRHFLWHAKPEKYDLFHMTLHSIWYNRVCQIKPR
ncbi:Exostosin family protein [Melia azedarach]|uniref:Exostosin family protein n=1 Tax=Melia azedarach TaxID=155640 RepID=A0ACC1XAU5_MELAZ|nr:Exostosin family protein [Melia azedarach]